MGKNVPGLVLNLELRFKKGIFKTWDGRLVIGQYYLIFNYETLFKYFC